MSANELTVEALLRAHAPHAPESLRARVLELEPRRTPSRRLVLVVVPAAVAIGVAAAIVHGFASSSSSPKQTALHAFAPKARVLVPTNGAGAAATNGAGAAAAGVPSVGGGGARLQRTEASLELRVADVSSATTRATRIVTSLGGFAQSVTYSSSSRTASLVLRVPVQNVKTAVAQLNALGTIVSQNLSVTDLEHDLQAETAQIAELRHTIAALEAALRSPSLSEAQRVLLQIRLANAKRSLSQRLHARTGTIAAGTNATIALHLETKRAAVAPAHHRGRFGRIVHSAADFLGLEGAIALYALIAVSPLALVAVLLWSLRQAYRRRAFPM